MSGGWQALRETDRDLALALLFAPAAAQNKYVEFCFCHMIAAIRRCLRPVKSSIITRVTKAKAHGRV